MNDIILTVAEVAEILHTNREYVYDLIKQGFLPALKLGYLKVRKEALLKFLEENEGKDLSIKRGLLLICTYFRRFKIWFPIV